MPITKLRDLAAIQTNIPYSVVDKDEIIPSAIHFREAQHEHDCDGGFFLVMSRGTGRRCHIEFWRYLLPSEKARCVARNTVCLRRAAIFVRGRLQRPGSRSSETDAARRSLFCFAFCK